MQINYETIDQLPVGSQRQPRPALARPPRLLIISDSSDRLAQLRASLAVDGVEVTSASAPEELGQACRHGHDVAVVDVGPAHLVGVLKNLRMSTGYREIPVLVEASRVLAEPALVGVLPKYRAMPCSQADLITLARRQIASTTGRPNPRRIL